MLDQDLFVVRDKCLFVDRFVLYNRFTVVSSKVYTAIAVNACRKNGSKT